MMMHPESKPLKGSYKFWISVVFWLYGYMTYELIQSNQDYFSEEAFPLAAGHFMITVFMIIGNILWLFSKYYKSNPLYVIIAVPFIRLNKFLDKILGDE